MLIFLLAALQPVPATDGVRIFGDWAVACDNVHACEMTSLLPGEAGIPDDDHSGDLSVARAAGPAGGFTIEVSVEAADGPATLAIDGAAATRGTLRGNVLRIAGAEAARIAPLLANGKAVELQDAAGKGVALISLAGASAALRFIDANQGRAGTVTAAVAKGSRPASAVPPAQPLPRIVALRPSGTAAPVSAALRGSLEKRSGCDENYADGEERPAIDRYALGGGKTLVLIPCGAGAYNFSSAAFILAGGKADAATFDQGDDVLVNADFDKGVLSAHEKGRGVGDCGEGRSYVWNGRSFELIEVRSMPDCRGSANWLRIFHAEPVFR